MFTKSPLMRPTFTPTQSRTTVEALSARINNILNLLDTPSKSRQQTSESPHAWRESESVIMAEIQRIQEVITDLIALFQDYRSSIDEQLEGLAKDVCNMESRMESLMEERFKKMKEEVVEQANENIMKSFHRLDEIGFFDQVVSKSLQKQKVSLPPLPVHRCEVSIDDIDNLKEELAIVKDAEIQIIAKINAIAAANTDCHEKSAEAIKSIRDILNNHQVINR